MGIARTVYDSYWCKTLRPNMSGAKAKTLATAALSRRNLLSSLESSGQRRRFRTFDSKA